MTTWLEFRSEPVEITPDIWFREITTKTVDFPYNDRKNSVRRVVTKVFVMCDNMRCKDIEVQNGEFPDDVAQAHLEWHENGMPE